MLRAALSLFPASAEEPSAPARVPNQRIERNQDPVSAA
jgi:hypothetical protein